MSRSGRDFNSPLGLNGRQLRASVALWLTNSTWRQGHLVITQARCMSGYRLLRPKRKLAQTLLHEAPVALRLSRSPRSGAFAAHCIHGRLTQRSCALLS